jgi:8-oxo-dGTP diphosphatase
MTRVGPCSCSDATITAGSHRAGVLELGESIDDGLRREVWEETGLDIEPAMLTGVYKNMKRGIIALVFRRQITGGEPALSNETEAIRWAAEAEVTELTNEAYAIRVLDALRASSRAAIRKHDGVQLL